MVDVSERIKKSSKSLMGTPYRINLSNLEKIRVEMSRIYREARSGQIPVSDATKLTFILTQIVKVYESTEIERRLIDLEHHLK